MGIAVKRVYDEPSGADGLRVLVDRLWPRGLSKERAAVDLWMRDIAPTTELRKWFHAGGRYEEFVTRYREELRDNSAVEELRNVVSAHPVVTLLFGVKDAEHNHAFIVRDVLASGPRFIDS